MVQNQEICNSLLPDKTADFSIEIPQIHHVGLTEMEGSKGSKAVGVGILYYQ